MTEDSLSANTIMEGMETRFIGRKVLYFPSVTSTNEIAKQEARQGTDEGTVIITDEQTGGRGRLKRAWLTPEGNIALSIILYPDISCLPSLIMLASLAVVHSIEETTDLKSQIKWPNDVLINGKKVCGILIESDVQGNNVNYVVIGIGINTNLRLSEYPEIQLTATSLYNELGREVPRLSVVRHLLTQIERLYLIISTGRSIYEEWRGKLVTLGKSIRVTTGEAVYEGVAESAAQDGSLILRGLDGKLNKIVAGDVTLRN